MKPIKVVSLFNGMGCAWLALDKAGIEVKKRYSSEINAKANFINDKNYPDTIQLGDVTKVKGSDLGHIDLLVGGSPCQGFSIAGKMLNFNDPRSRLFFEYVRILNELREINPNIKFMLENNVGMKQWCIDVISRYLGVLPKRINSNLFSAQNRDRLYWCNWRIDMNIRSKNLVIRDILEDRQVEEKYYLSDKLLKTFSYPSGKDKSFFFKELFEEDKAKTLTARYFKRGRTDNYITERKPIQLNQSKESGGKQPYQQNRIYDANSIAPCLMANLSTGANYIQYDLNGKGNKSQDQRVFFEDGQMNTLSASRTETKTKTLIGKRIRMLTPIECERLQTVPDNYTEGVSDSARYEMLGNGWTVDVIAHIFQGLKSDSKQINHYALELFA